MVGTHILNFAALLFEVSCVARAYSRKMSTKQLDVAEELEEHLILRLPEVTDV